MPKIVLTMIVKNEGHVIERVLNSVLPLIDTYCIVDTGSTDNTKEIITDFFNSKNINGKLIDFPFTNFEECRNQTIIHGKELGDYGFWIDADEKLVLSKDFNKTNFSNTLLKNSPDLVYIDCLYSGMKYTRGQLFNFSTDFIWTGPVHEYLSHKKDTIKTDKFTQGYCEIFAEGNSWKSDLSEKYENHAKILLDYQEKNNWNDPRWTFYLAQSYRDAGMTLLGNDPNNVKGLDFIKKSISYYKERVLAKGGFSDEVYFSQLMVARLSYYVKTNEEVLVELLKCEEHNHYNRCEHIYNLVSFYQRENMFKNAEIWCKEGLKKIKDGLKSTLFIENYIYDWALYDAYGTTIYYLGRFDEALKYTKYSLKKADEKNNLPITERKRIEDNIKSIETAISQRRN